MEPQKEKGGPDIDIGEGATPQKYVRTFAGDMEALKSGGKPDLAPIPPVEVEAVPPVPVPPIVPAPSPTMQTEPQSETEWAPSPLAEEKFDSTPEERLVAGSLVPVPAPVPEEVLTTPSERESATSQGPTPIHTYAEDFSQHVKDTSASQLTVLAAEQDAGATPGTESTAEHKGNMLYVTAGAVLLAVGAVGLYYGYTQYVLHSSPIIIAPTVAAPIFVDEREQIVGTSTVLAQAIEQSATRALASGAVRMLYTPVSTTTGQSVFLALQLPAPGVLVRNINDRGSMAGIVNAGGTQAPFFILSVTSYGDTFAGMLSWEPTMPKSLALFYPQYQPPAVTNNATTTATSTAPAPQTTTPGFRDQVIANHDARVYLDAYGHASVVYGYWDQKTLVIAHDPAAFTEILSRLATSRTQ